MFTSPILHESIQHQFHEHIVIVIKYCAHVFIVQIFECAKYKKSDDDCNNSRLMQWLDER